ncbi:MAG: HEAT repeat domain-containing protein, partial [Leadbetterella sp.]|nr:HEAT repeat domain-containing protein [Leadbetterella sp.]
ADKKLRELIFKALDDPYWRVRQMAVQRLNDYDGEDFLRVEKALENAIREDSASNVRADALLSVRNFQNPYHVELARKAMTDTVLRRAGCCSGDPAGQ